MIHHVHRVVTHRHFIPAVLVASVVAFFHDKVPETFAFIASEKATIVQGAEEAIKELTEHLRQLPRP